MGRIATADMSKATRMTRMRYSAHEKSRSIRSAVVRIQARACALYTTGFTPSSAVTRSWKRSSQRIGLDYIRNGYTLACMRTSEPQVPLTPAVFHILLALVGQERHGYDIMQQVKSDSQGAVKMGPGTLYGSLDRMIEAGLVAKGNTQDPRRIYYKLTTFGLATLRAETERLSHLAVVARRQLGTA
jgi:DNA-binding MarR family transcriptional regulator